MHWFSFQESLQTWWSGRERFRSSKFSSHRPLWG